jgi:membrane protein required for colicin V production
MTDILIAAAIIIGVWRGLSTGVIRQLAGIAGIIIAFVMGVQLMGPIGEALSGVLGISEGVGRVLAFILIVIGVHVLLAITARLLETILGILRLSSIERGLGGVLGGVKAALIASVVLLVLAVFDVPSERSRTQSALYKPVAGLLPEAWDFLAEHLPAMKEIADEFGRDVAERLDIGRDDH